MRILVFLSFFCVSLVVNRANGQTGITTGAPLPELEVKKTLNQTTPFKHLSDLKDNNIVILDFFGTWCAPCLRALPHLKEVQDKFSGQLKVILVSNETESRLQKFLDARTNFPFAIIVDQTNEWNKAFNPPALPFTVVIKDGKIVTVTTAEAITTENVHAWLSDQIVTGPAAVNKKNSPNNALVNDNLISRNPLVKISQQFLYAAKTGEVTINFINQLRGLEMSELETQLDDDDTKKAFWINIYNGFTQTSLKADSAQYQNRKAFFKKKNIVIAGKAFSLDDIEHGILRRSKIKWSLGLLNKWFPPSAEKKLRVAKLDYRIHFALNCGAKSCPPIAYYNNELISKQLDVATKAYLTGEADYDPQKDLARLPALMSWFRADFGGKKGMRRILHQYEILPAGATPAIKFKKYDWSLTLENYSNTK